MAQFTITTTDINDNEIGTPSIIDANTGKVVVEVEYESGSTPQTTVSSGNIIIPNPSDALPISYVALKMRIEGTSFATNDTPYLLANESARFATEINYNLEGITPIYDENDISQLLNDNVFENKNLWTNTKGGTVTDGSDGSLPNYLINHFYSIAVSLNFGAPKGTQWDGCAPIILASTENGFTDWLPFNGNIMNALSAGTGEIDTTLYNASNWGADPVTYLSDLQTATTAIFWRADEGIASSARIAERSVTSGSTNIGMFMYRYHDFTPPATVESLTIVNQ